MVLTGRESLIRLIGKRRRFLPNRHSILSDPIPIPPQQSTAPDPQNDVVHCPVCGRTLPSDNRRINSHLDSCLSPAKKEDSCFSQPKNSGTKRKLTQRTLLQLNFTRPVNLTNATSLVRDDTCGEDSQFPEIENQIHCVELDSASTTSPSLPSTSNNIDSHPDIDSNNIDIHIGNDNDIDSNNEIDSNDDIDNNKDDKPSIFGVKLETFIVGRKYADQEEVCVGTIVSLLRDPENVKDPNAIKVVSADSECSKFLGYLPRELAQYLSLLIDEYGLVFQGHVTSLPKHSLDVVPIQIMCHGTQVGESEYEDETFKGLWKNAQHVVESAIRNPSSSVKYQLNFRLMLQEVLRNNIHLLTEDEKNYMESFTLLSNDSQRLFIRLYTRKGPWFRMSSISYPEIMDAQKAVKELAEKEYLCSIEDGNQLCENDMNDILNVLTVSELHEIWCFLHKKSCGRGMKKQDLILSLLSTYAGLWPHLSTMILDRTSSCIRISSKAESLIWRTERLFFLNGEQDLSSFLLVDIGKIKYPTYNCIILEPIFSNRKNLLAYEEAIEVAQIMDEALDANKTDVVLRCIKIAESHASTSLPIRHSTSESVSTIRHLFTASWIYSKVITLGISFLEQERRYSDAIDLLKWLQNVFTCDVRRGYWTLRLSVDLEHLGYIDESLQVAENGLLDPLVRAGSRMALQRRVLRLGKPPRRWKVPSFSRSALRKIPEVYVQGRPLNSELGAKNRFYNEEGMQCGVEQLALHYYAEGGWQGVHSESGIWLTIFGLLMWDVIYADVPNVFYTRFQNAPLDLGTDSFYMARKGIIESHLQKICDGMSEEFLIKSWETHNGTACRGVNWDRHSLDELRAAVTCVGGSCLASLCQHLCQDYRSWSSGMPDLLLWRFYGKYSGEAKLVEVKGPRDRLSEQQRAWLLLLMDCGFMIEVCKVKPL